MSKPTHIIDKNSIRILFILKLQSLKNIGLIHKDSYGILHYKILIYLNI